MPISRDIARSYIRPRQVMAERLAAGPREDRALAYLMGACVLIFVAQWPRLSREAFVDPSVELNALMAGALFGWVLVAPLFFYCLALVVHWILRLLGRGSTGYKSRIALFWALLAAAPMWLLSGLLNGFAADSPGTSLIGIVALGAFVVFWASGVLEISKEPAAKQG